MKILIIGNDPHDIAGVSNYTRSLAQTFVDLGHEIYYFYSGAWNRKYNWFFKPYLRMECGEFPFECAELINSPNLSYNYANLLSDISAPQTEKIFRKYLATREPDVVHIHSRLGLPASIIKIASDQRIPVFNSIHVYGLLCPKRVMIDNQGIPCPEPLSIDKCASCLELWNIRGLKLMARLENTSQKGVALIFRLKKEIMGSLAKNAGRSFFSSTNDVGKEVLKEDLYKRRSYMRWLMNEVIDMNICVSSDVNKTLQAFGVREEKLLVQHIGSSVAERQKRHMHRLHSPLVVGNIGGVGSYKGTHVLIDAVTYIKNTNFEVKIFGKYEQSYVQNIMSGKGQLRVTFMGKYDPQDLPRILQEIDLTVLPSICNDTAPQTVFESFSARIPIIASNIGGFPDFIQDGVNGYLFRPGDSQDLANKLAYLLNHPHVICELSEKVPRLKTIKENALELTTLYEHALRERN
jgi:glycosyltransferase involved in cell wall biosynthesis